MMPPEFGDGRQGYAQTGDSAAVLVVSMVITPRRTVIWEDLDMSAFVCVCCVWQTESTLDVCSRCTRWLHRDGFLLLGHLVLN
jgi:hypothetical protein